MWLTNLNKDLKVRQLKSLGTGSSVNISLMISAYELIYLKVKGHRTKSSFHFGSKIIGFGEPVPNLSPLLLENLGTWIFSQKRGFSRFQVQRRTYYQILAEITEQRWSQRQYCLIHSFTFSFSFLFSLFLHSQLNHLTHYQFSFSTRKLRR